MAQGHGFAIHVNTARRQPIESKQRLGYFRAAGPHQPGETQDFAST